MVNSYSQTINREEAKKAYEHLNLIRQNPAAHSQRLKADLNNVKPQPALKWNDTLAKVAENKAMDMAKRKYFDHVDPDGDGINIKIHKAGYKLPKSWIKDKKSNYFESIAAGIEGGPAVIDFLIIDKRTPSLGHRKHLLSMEEFYATCHDIGVGYVDNAQNSPYSTYICVIIAKHGF
ncbi:MAG: CAP domain-containing protein [Bacteroidia bacterium]|nr:CAP domain-containing protein [Bacteroidia bacterium]